MLTSIRGRNVPWNSGMYDTESEAEMDNTVIKENIKAIRERILKCIITNLIQMP